MYKRQATAPRSCFDAGFGCAYATFTGSGLCATGLATGAGFACGFFAGAAFFGGAIFFGGAGFAALRDGAGLDAGLVADFAAAFACGLVFATDFFTGFFGAAFLAGLLDFLMGRTLFADLDFDAAAGFFAGLALRAEAPDFAFDFAMSCTRLCDQAVGCYSLAPTYRQPIDKCSRNPFPSPVNAVLTRLLLCLIAAYKKLLSPLLGSQCRFHPTCSSYARIAISRYGPARGSLMAIWRILRCQSLCSGGLDEVLETFVPVSYTHLSQCTISWFIFNRT